MSKVIPFPNQKERSILKYQKTVLRRKWAFAKINAIAKTIGLKLLYYFRIVLANITHYALVILLSIVVALRKPILVIACGVSLITYLNLNRYFISTDHYTLPFFIALSLFSMLGDQIADLINLHTPFHHLFKCNKRENKAENHKRMA